MQNQTRNLVIVALVAALVAVTCWKQTSGQGEPAKPAVVKWEYKLHSGASSDLDADELNRLGAQGWDACLAFTYGPNHEKTIFKRPLAGK